MDKRKRVSFCGRTPAIEGIVTTEGKITGFRDELLTFVQAVVIAIPPPVFRLPNMKFRRDDRDKALLVEGENP
jgi:hypothetical protein